MNHGSLFSGIGGFDLAAEWMGWENKFHCEWNEFGQRVLKYYWPKAISYEDITKTDFTIWRGRIDVLTGGFPCQPYSLAGKRLGKEDERHLWPEMLRAIREIQPRWVVGENVLGLVNWNGGLVFDEVQAELEAQGYEVQPYVLPACAVNAPHRRDRVWFVAYARGERHRGGNIKPRTDIAEERAVDSYIQQHGNGVRCETEGRGSATSNTNNSGDASLRCETDGNWQEKSIQRKQPQPEFGGSCVDGTATDTECSRRIQVLHNIQQEQSNGAVADSTCSERAYTNTESQSSERVRFEQREPCEHEKGQLGGDGSWLGSKLRTDWTNFPTVSPVCNGDDGISAKLDGITFSKWRAESVKAGGNAIVPQVALQIFKSIQQYEQGCSH